MNPKQIRPNEPVSAPKGKSQRPLLPTGIEQSDNKEILFLGAGLITLTLGLGGLFMYSADEPLPVTASQKAAEEVSTFQMANAFATSTPPSTTPIPRPSVPVLNEEPSVHTLDHSLEMSEPDSTNVYFDFDRWGLTEKAKALINTQVEALSDDWKGTINIQGHTDARGADTYNKVLGLKRANAVRAFVVSLGIPDDRIQVETLGKDGSVCVEDTPTCFEQNRRAQLAVLPTSVTAENDGQIEQVSPIQNAALETDALSTSQDSPTSESSMASLNAEDASAELISAEPLMTAESQP